MLGLDFLLCFVLIALKGSNTLDLNILHALLCSYGFKSFKCMVIKSENCKKIQQFEKIKSLSFEKHGGGP